MSSVWEVFVSGKVDIRVYVGNLLNQSCTMIAPKQECACTCVYIFITLVPKSRRHANKTVRNFKKLVCVVFFWMQGQEELGMSSLISQIEEEVCPQTWFTRVS